MVTMQVRSVAMLQRRLHPCQNGVAVALLHAVEKTFLVAQPMQLVCFFFHEYGRRVGMVPRSSLKEGKKRQMVEKGTKTPKTNPKTKHQSPQADSTIL